MTLSSDSPTGPRGPRRSGAGSAPPTALPPHVEDGQPPHGPPDLQARLRDYRRLARDTHTGPLKMAFLLLHLAKNWEDYRPQADGLDMDDWARITLGNQQVIAKALRRVKSVQAAEKLGYSRAFLLSNIDHLLLVRVMGPTVPIPAKKKVLAAIFREQRERGTLLELSMGVALLNDLLKRRSERKVRNQRLRQVYEYLAATETAKASHKTVPPMPGWLRTEVNRVQKELRRR